MLKNFTHFANFRYEKLPYIFNNSSLSYFIKIWTNFHLVLEIVNGKPNWFNLIFNVSAEKGLRIFALIGKIFAQFNEKLNQITKEMP